MAKCTYVDIDPPEEEFFYKGLTAQDRFTHPRLTRKLTLISRKRVVGITARSLLPQIVALWNAFSAADKTAWSNAGAQRGLNGYRLFVQDQSARIKNEIGGTATPSLLHQSWVGELLVVAPATELKIAQYHPRSYWISKKVVGKKGMFEPVLVTEDLGLPLTISLNYESDLAAAGPAPSAKFYAEVRSSYQGQDIFTKNEIVLDLVTGWKNASAILTTVSGYVIGYTLYIHIKDLRGEFYCDNIKATHSGQNWVRDTYCEDINEAFTRAFYQIPKHWIAIEIPEGAEYNSVYKDF